MRPDDLPRFRQSPTDAAFMADPYPAYERLRALGPVAYWEELGKPVLSGHAEVSAVLRDRRFGREVTHLASREALGWDPIPERLAPFYAFEEHSLLEREPPAHTRLRRLVNRAFTSRAVAGLGPRIEGLAESLVDRFDPETELMERFATPIPLTVSAELLGAPVEAGPQMLAWSHDMVGMYQAGRDRAAEDRAVAATEAFSAFMRGLIAERPSATPCGWWWSGTSTAAPSRARGASGRRTNACGWIRRCISSPATRWARWRWRACACGWGRRWACCWRPPTATPPCSPIPPAPISAARGRSGMSRWGRGCISASARRWRGSRSARRWRCCSAGCRSCAWRRRRAARAAGTSMGTRR